MSALNNYNGIEKDFFPAIETYDFGYKSPSEDLAEKKEKRYRDVLLKLGAMVGTQGPIDGMVTSGVPMSLEEANSFKNSIPPDLIQKLQLNTVLTAGPENKKPWKMVYNYSAFKTEVQERKLTEILKHSYETYGRFMSEFIASKTTEIQAAVSTHDVDNAVKLLNSLKTSLANRLPTTTQAKKHRDLALKVCDLSLQQQEALTAEEPTRTGLSKIKPFVDMLTHEINQDLAVYSKRSVPTSGIYNSQPQVVVRDIAGQSAHGRS